MRSSGQHQLELGDGRNDGTMRRQWRQRWSSLGLGLHGREGKVREEQHGVVLLILQRGGQDAGEARCLPRRRGVRGDSGATVATGKEKNFCENPPGNLFCNYKEVQ